MTNDKSRLIMVHAMSTLTPLALMERLWEKMSLDEKIHAEANYSREEDNATFQYEHFMQSMLKLFEAETKSVFQGATVPELVSDEHEQRWHDSHVAPHKATPFNEVLQSLQEAVDKHSTSASEVLFDAVCGMDAGGFASLLKNPGEIEGASKVIKWIRNYLPDSPKEYNLA